MCWRPRRAGAPTLNLGPDNLCPGCAAYDLRDVAVFPMARAASGSSKHSAPCAWVAVCQRQCGGLLGELWVTALPLLHDIVYTGEGALRSARRSAGGWRGATWPAGSCCTGRAWPPSPSAPPTRTRWAPRGLNRRFGIVLLLRLPGEECITALHPLGLSSGVGMEQGLWCLCSCLVTSVPGSLLGCKQCPEVLRQVQLH